MTSSNSLLDIVIPTLNCSSDLLLCLQSIKNQKVSFFYRIIVADGGSDDETLKIARRYKCIVFPNPLRTAEAGKAVGYHHSTSKYVAFIDSDNILPRPDYLSTMIEHLEKNMDVVAAEPYKFTYRRTSGFIERYCALLGANDPYAFFAGVYDRYSTLSEKWTPIKLSCKEFYTYYKCIFSQYDQVPTFGANGTIYRHSFLDQLSIKDYIFDIDLINLYLRHHKSVKFLKVKNSIIHTYCQSSIKKFIKKQTRRIVDYFNYRHYRSYDWQKTNRYTPVLFTLYSLSLVFPTIDSIRGFSKKPDLAWFFHPLACIVTSYVYVTNYLKNILRQTNFS